ncbi:hypothetical protein BH10BAC1_BH10BAC1_12640 [soil metagenome]
MLLLNLFEMKTSCAQTNTNSTNQTDNKGLKQGKWIITKKNSGQKIAEGLYTDDLKEGEWLNYYPSGQIESRIDFTTGKPEGFTIMYFSTGKIKEYGYWHNNKWVGDYELFYENGSTHQKIIFNSDGKRIGFSKFYFLNGIISDVAFVMNGEEEMTLSCDSTGKITKTQTAMDYYSLTAIKQMHEIVRSENEHTFQKNKIIQQQIESIRKEKELALANEKAQKQKIITNSIVALLMLVLLFVISILRGYKQKQTANKELLKKKLLPLIQRVW